MNIPKVTIKTINKSIKYIYQININKLWCNGRLTLKDIKYLFATKQHQQIIDRCCISEYNIPKKQCVDYFNSKDGKIKILLIQIEILKEPHLKLSCKPLSKYINDLINRYNKLTTQKEITNVRGVNNG